MRAVIYARYSSHSQREESIEGQLRECYQFAEQNDITVIKEYCDRALSGTTDKRPMFQKMIKDSEKGTFDVVIMYTLDRFARNRYDSAIYKAKLKKNGVKILYAKQPISDTPEGIILESVLEGYAEYYSENLSRNVKRGMTENALQCKSTGGSHVLGYTTDENKNYKIDPVGAKTVQFIFEQYAKGYSASQVVDACNARGYKTALGRDFGKSSLATILRNKKYIGIYQYADITVENGIPAIIDKALFQKVQDRLKTNTKYKAKAKAHNDYILTGKLFCGYCNKMMIGESGRGKKGKMYYYYKCSTQKKNSKACHKHTEKKDVIEKLIIEYTINHVLTDENIELISTRTLELIEKELKDTSVITALENELKDVESRLNNLINAIEQGIVTKTTRERLGQLEVDKENLETRIAIEETKKPKITKEHIKFWLLSFKKGDIDSLDFRKKIVDTLINSVYIYDDDDEGTNRRIVLNFNISDNRTKTVKISDIEGDGAPQTGINSRSFLYH